MNDADDEYAVIIEEKLQKLHDLTRFFEKLMHQFHQEAASEEAYKQLLKKAFNSKKKTPEQFQEAQQKIEEELSSTIANQRYQAMKPLNRKSAHKRTWI